MTLGEGGRVVKLILCPLVHGRLGRGCGAWWIGPQIPPPNELLGLGLHVLTFFFFFIDLLFGFFYFVNLQLGCHVGLVGPLVRLLVSTTAIKPIIWSLVKYHETGKIRKT